MKVTTIILFMFSLTFTVEGQERQISVVFQSIEMNILKDSFRTATLLITETDKSITYLYHFLASSEKYIFHKKSQTNLTFIKNDKELDSMVMRLESSAKKNSKRLGDLFKLSAFGISEGQSLFDSGSNGLFSLNYGLIYIKSSQTQTGEIIHSLDQKSISEKEKYELFYR